ncbi:MAG: universal stress protein [Elsteraceae bacterium]
MSIRVAYMPLSAYPEAIADRSILAAARFAAAQGYQLEVRAFSVEIRRVYSPLGGLLLNAPGLVQAAEDKSEVECQRLNGFLEESAEIRPALHYATRRVALGGTEEAAATEARNYDLSVLPWSSSTVLALDMAEAMVFGSGRPAILVPPDALPARLDHIAIGWDASRVAARALGDALALLPEGGHVSVLTIEDEKPLSGPDVAETLASSLERRGFKVKPHRIAIGDDRIAEALQKAALKEGAQLLAMGGFGHSRMRDFVLGGATKGVLSHLMMPTLLSH